jgi:hypothetical protein
MIEAILLFSSLTILMVGTYIIWPSKYNIPAHVNAGFIFPAYFSPIIILATQETYDPDIFNLYFKVVVFGTLFYFVGLIIGNRVNFVKFSTSFDVLKKQDYETRIIKIVKFSMYAGIIGLIISYAVMGYIPFFASDPISAKFFRGAYKDGYSRVSVIYRASVFIIINMIPISIIIAYYKKQIIFYFLAFAAFVLLFLALSRGPAFTGVLLAIIIICVRKGRFYFWGIFLCLFVIFSIGSSFYYMFDLIDFDFDNVMATKRSGLEFWQIISSGTQDVPDQLYFLKMFESNPIYTYGRTFYGGLIPNHYQWNPNVYNLNIVSPGTDIDEVVSGGIRLPAPIWGYVSFGWIGVMLLPLFSGLITGALTRVTRNWVRKHSSPITLTVIILINMILFNQLQNFFLLSIYNIPAIAIIIIFMYRFKFK